VAGSGHAGIGIAQPPVYASAGGAACTAAAVPGTSIREGQPVVRERSSHETFDVRRRVGRAIDALSSLA